MNVIPLHHVGQRLMHTVRGPAVLRGIVGAGYVVGVCLPNKTVGGMAHLAVHGPELYGGARGLVDELFRCLAEYGERMSGASAFVAGGADVLKVIPSNQRSRQVEAQVELLKEILRSHQTEIAQLRVGGVESKRVELHLPGGVFKVGGVARKPEKIAAPNIPTPPVRPHEHTFVHAASDTTVEMGCLAVATAPGRLVALLGSCVGVALFDAASQSGGLAHVMMPARQGRNGNPAKYADTAVDALCEAMAKGGAHRRNLRAKLAGGAYLLGSRGQSNLLGIGEENIRAARQALKRADIPVEWEDTGGREGRKMYIDLKRFDVVIKSLGSPEGL